jgi:zinc protease
MSAPVIAKAAVAIPPLAFTERTLGNGLRVYAMRDITSPNVSVQVWYDVGSKDDPAGRSGFAHLFEHLLFKATRNLVPEQLDRLTEDVGGFNNASTWDDLTNYYETVPANHLQRLLWAEAERMGSLVVDEGNFKSEREVVKEELRTGLARPYGKLFGHYIPEVSYTRHPYARPGIGSIEELDSSTLADVRAFHATYYRPDNAVVVVSGNFEPAQLSGWVDQYFAPLKRPTTPIPRVKVAEPQRLAARSYTVNEPNTPLPAVVLTYLAPPATSPDSDVLEVIETILATGANSRFNIALVRTRIATDAGVNNEVKAGPSLFAPYAILAGGKQASEAERVIRTELARLSREAVSPAELAEAKNTIITAALLERESVDGRANALAEGVILEKDPRAADKSLAAIQRVSQADIQRVAARYLSDRQSVAIRYLPAAAGATASTGAAIAVPSSVELMPLAIPAGIRVVEPASEAERIAPPPPAPDIAVVPPPVVTSRLANGLTIVTVTRTNLPLVSVALVSNVGSTAEPITGAGTAKMAADLLTKGTTTRSATQIAAAIETLGAELDSEANRDGLSLQLTARTDQLEPALTIMADVARNPAFAPEEIERQRGQAIDEAALALQSPGTLARLAATRALFGAGSYGRPVAGTRTSLKLVDRASLQNFYRQAFRPDGTTLVVTGDVTSARAQALAERLFGDWKADAAAPAATPQPTGGNAPLKGKIVVIDMPGSSQAAVAVVRETAPRNDPSYYPTLLANAVLGGGYSARLNREIRIKRGLSYGASSNVAAGRQTGLFATVPQTKNQSAPEVLQVIKDEMQRLGREPISDAEFGTRVANVNGNFGRELETVGGLNSLVTGFIQQGVDPIEIGRFAAAVRGVVPVAAGAAGASHLAPQSSTVVIVGDSKLFISQLRAAVGDVVVIPMASVDLDSPTLR